MTVWLALVLGGIATYLTRFTPLVVRVPGAAPPALRRYLDARSDAPLTDTPAGSPLS